MATRGWTRRATSMLADARRVACTGMIGGGLARPGLEGAVEVVETKRAAYWGCTISSFWKSCVPNVHFLDSRW
jgi:hypothetical protein